MKASFFVLSWPGIEGAAAPGLAFERAVFLPSEDFSPDDRREEGCEKVGPLMLSVRTCIVGGMSQNP